MSLASLLKNRRANDSPEAIDIIRGGIGQNVPTEPERFEVPVRMASMFKDEQQWRSHADPWTVGA